MAANRAKATMNDLVFLRMHGHGAHTVEQAQAHLDSLTDEQYGDYMDRRSAVYDPDQEALTEDKPSLTARQQKAADKKQDKSDAKDARESAKQAREDAEDDPDQK